MKFIKIIVSNFLRVGISIILLYLLFRQVDRKALFEIIRGADKGLLFLAFCIFFFSYLLCIFRWEMLLKAVNIHLSLKRIIISFSGGVFFSLFMPSTIGGDLMRSIDLATHTKRPHEVVATVLLDRLSGYVGLVLLALLSLGFGWKVVQDKGVILAIAIITAVLIIVLFTLFNKFIYSKISSALHSPKAGKFQQLVKDLHQEMHYFRRHKKVIINNLIFSILIQTVTPLTFYVVALSLGLKIKLAYFFIYLPIIGAITLLPISIGGLGLRDYATITFFAKAGVTNNLAFAMSLISFFFILVYAAIGGIIYVLTVRHRRIQHHKLVPLHP